MKDRYARGLQAVPTLAWSGRLVVAVRLAVAVTLFGLLGEVVAEPYIALREGYKCSACHVNKTGGGKRTAYGALYTQTELTPLLESLSDGSTEFATDLNSSISIGVDFMATHRTQLSVEERLRTAQLDTVYEQGSANSFDVDSGNLYLEAQLVPERLSLYLDETVTPSGASSREAFVLVDGLPAAAYVKAGRMLLPYGIRLWDDGSFIRQVTGFNYDNQDMGFEVGFEPSQFALSVAVTNGTQGGSDNNKGKQVSAVGSVFLPANITLGGSFSRNKSRGIERLVMGPFASARLGPVTVIGEADWLSDSGGVDRDQFVGYASLEYWCRDAVNFRLAFDYLDPYDALEEDERSRLTLGADAFLTPNLSASASYELKESIPQDLQGNADAVRLAVHSFF